MVEFAITPAETALINVDLQNCFVEGSPIASPEGPAVVGRVNRLARSCRENGVAVVHTAHLLRPDRSNTGVLGEILPLVNDGIIDHGAATGAYHPALDISDDDILLEKPRFGAFHGTDLELILRNRGIDTVIVTGIATNVCCETTAREANVRDFRVIFMRDATACHGIGDLSAADIQAATCATLGSVFAEVTTVDDVISRIEIAGGVTARRNTD
jgi:nicotinamidase-related amidase